MYSKEVTALILADWAEGASAEETRKHLEDTLGIKPCLNTIYTHRNSLTTKDLVDELLRQQERDLTKEENSALRMKYRNELLKILLPQRVEIREDVNVQEKSLQVTLNIEQLNSEAAGAIARNYMENQSRQLRSTGNVPIQSASDSNQ